MVDSLTTKVIDEKQTAVRLELNRRFIELGSIVELQFEHVDCQFTTDDHTGSLDTHPAVVIIPGIVGGRHRLVVMIIIDPDDLTIDLDGVGDEDMPLEASNNTLGDGGFTVTGLSEQEHTSSGVDSRTDRVDCSTVHHDVGEGDF